MLTGAPEMERADAWHLTEQIQHELGKGDPFAAAIRATRMSMLITNPRLPDNPIVFANDAFLHLTGYERHESMDRNCRFLQGPDTDQIAIAKVRDAFGKGATSTSTSSTIEKTPLFGMLCASAP